MEPPTTLDELLQSHRYNKILQAIVDASFTRPSNFTLWIGAGFSSHFAQFPSWKEFLLALCENINDSEEMSLSKLLIEKGRYQIAAEYISSLIPDKVFESIQKCFSTSKIGKDLIVGDFCAQTIVTTNYDILLERSYGYYKVCSPIDDIYTLFSDRSKLLKIHGSIEIPKNCVLSVSQYAKLYNRDLDYLMINLIATQDILFIGASLDPREPYFRHMNHIHKRSLTPYRRWAILSFPPLSKEDIADKCRDIHDQYGILVVPYIPNGRDHTCFRDILNHLRERSPGRSAISENLAYVRKRVEQPAFDLDEAIELIPLYKRLATIGKKPEISAAQKFEIISAFEKFTSLLLSPKYNFESFYEKTTKIGIPIDSVFKRFSECIQTMEPSIDICRIIRGLIDSAQQLNNFRVDSYDTVQTLKNLLSSKKPQEPVEKNNAFPE